MSEINKNRRIRTKVISHLGPTIFSVKIYEQNILFPDLFSLLGFDRKSFWFGFLGISRGLSEERPVAALLASGDPSAGGRLGWGLPVSGRLGRSLSVEGRLGRSLSVEGRLGRSLSVEGRLGRSLSVEGRLGRSLSVEGRLGRSLPVAGRLDRDPSANRRLGKRLLIKRFGSFFLRHTWFLSIGCYFGRCRFERNLFGCFLHLFHWRSFWNTRLRKISILK